MSTGTRRYLFGFLLGVALVANSASLVLSVLNVRKIHALKALVEQQRRKIDSLKTRP